MKKYMVVYRDDEGNEGAVFRDKLHEAEDFRMNMVVSLGGYAEVYERVEVKERIGNILEVVSEEYQLIYA